MKSTRAYHSLAGQGRCPQHAKLSSIPTCSCCLSLASSACALLKSACASSSSACTPACLACHSCSSFALASNCAVHCMHHVCALHRCHMDNMNCPAHHPHGTPSLQTSSLAHMADMCIHACIIPVHAVVALSRVPLPPAARTPFHPAGVSQPACMCALWVCSR